MELFTELKTEIAMVKEFLKDKNAEVVDILDTELWYTYTAFVFDMIETVKYFQPNNGSLVYCHTMLNKLEEIEDAIQLEDEQKLKQLFYEGFWIGFENVLTVLESQLSHIKEYR